MLSFVAAMLALLIGFGLGVVWGNKHQQTVAADAAKLAAAQAEVKKL